MKDKNTIIEQLEQYPGLLAEEKELVLEEASKHEELSELVEEAKHWDTLLASASAKNVTDELLSVYWVMKSSDDLGPLFASEFERLEEQLQVDEELARRSDAIGVRQQMLEMSSDPAEQFKDLKERLAGRGPGRVRERPHQLESAIYARVAASFVILLLAYAGLLSFDQSQRSPRETLELQFDRESSLALLDEIARGHQTPEGERVVAILRLGINRYADARRSWLGIAPSYDLDRVEKVADSFQAVMHDPTAPDDLRVEAELLYGQALLTMGEFHLATQALVRVRQTNNPAVLPTASLLLTQLLEVR